MKKLEYGMVGLHASSGQVGRISQVGKSGMAGVFRTNTGTMFSVSADEIKPLDWTPDELERLELECLTVPRHEVKYVYLDVRHGQK